MLIVMALLGNLRKLKGHSWSTIVGVRIMMRLCTVARFGGIPHLAMSSG